MDECEPRWVSARRANLTCCPFYRLPDELILQILGNLDYISTAIALRTSGLFTRIIFDQTSSSPRQCVPKFQVWPPFKEALKCLPAETWPMQLSHRKQIHRLLDRDRFCDACRQFREDGRYDRAIERLQALLWCAHCDEHHRRPFFSTRQREVPSATRFCILAEGKVRVCAHRSISWKEAHDTEFSYYWSREQEDCRHCDNRKFVDSRLHREKLRLIIARIRLLFAYGHYNLTLSLGISSVVKFSPCPSFPAMS